MLEKLKDKKLNKEEKPKKRKNKQIVRVEDIERVMAEQGDNVDTDMVVSMYMPRRKTRKLAAALLRLDKLRLIILGLIAIIALLFILSFTQEKMGNFTVNLDRLELYRKGISIDEDANFSNPTARLEAASIKDASNITQSDLPGDIDKIDGDHNGNNYLAYTYYVRNSGKECLDYTATVKMVNASKGAENAVRIAVFRNGKRTVYAEPTYSGKAESGTTKFKNHSTACKYEVKGFDVGYVDKYTVVMWLEGEDAQCTDEIIGGSMQFEMNIESTETEETSLVHKFIEDIKDTVNDDEPIGSYGTEAPDDYDASKVTWKTRRNK